MPAFLDDYEPVEDRLAKFWADHPEGQIVTEILPAPEGQWIVKASVYRQSVRLLMLGGVIEMQPEKLYVFEIPDGVGHAQEHVTEKGVNSTSALENCETSAIGRALANLGYAAKGKRASREEMVKAKRGEEPARPDYAVWLSDQVELFKAWTEDERRVAYQAAMTDLNLDGLSSMKDAKRIFDRMTALYDQRPISESLPLEEK